MFHERTVVCESCLVFSGAVSSLSRALHSNKNMCRNRTLSTASLSSPSAGQIKLHSRWSLLRRWRGSVQNTNTDMNPLSESKVSVWNQEKTHRFGRKRKRASLFQSVEKSFSLALVCKVKESHRPWGNIWGFLRHASVRRITLMARHVSNAQNIAERHFSAFY